MHGTLATSRDRALELARRVAALSGVEVAILPPFPHLYAVAEAVTGSTVALGAQNVSEYAEGAYTGEVSSAMLLDCRCRFALVGHSERRHLFGESDAQVALKFQQALQAGLTPLLCVGETLAEREEDRTFDTLDRQLSAVLGRVAVADRAGLVIAYEPVWAIGTGKTATPAMAQSAHAFIRERLRLCGEGLADSTRILYGGSVKASNAKELFGAPDIDGGLIGGASLPVDEFFAICQAAAR
jgi:triosephosphate isomerase